MSKNLFIITLMVTFGTFGLAQNAITIDPNTQYQSVEGWGASLSWWANILGEHPDEKVDILVDWIVNPSHLNMNLFRFNIGAGDNPAHDHMRKDGGDMPSYKLSAEDDYLWSQDENQRRILQKIITRRSELIGKNDIKLVAFSTSPPWWMTKSACSAGANTASTNNLKEDMYDDFADYLSEVVKYYHDSLGITFNYLEPMNEPDGGWWVAEGNQEGCYFTVDKQIKILKEVYAALERKNMLHYCNVAGSDWNNIDNGVSALNTYINDEEVMNKMSHIDCHSYFGSNQGRQQLQAIAQQYNKSLWQSESGPLNIGNSSAFQVMHMAQRIITDMRLMKPDAWIDWQIVTNGSAQWGLVDGNYGNTLERCTKFPSFYIRSQYSRFIKPGYSIIHTNRDNTLAALSPNADELVLIICNTDTSGALKNYDIDLSLFDIGQGIPYQYLSTVDGANKTKRRFATINNNTINYSAPLQSVTTFVIPVSKTYEKPSPENVVLTDFENGIGLFSDISLHQSFSGTYPDDLEPHATWHIRYDSIIENPLKEINTSQYVFAVEQENSDWWGNFLNFKLANEGEGLAISESNRYLHIYHFRASIQDGWSVYINSEINCENEGNQQRANGNNSQVNKWEDIVIDLDHLIQEKATLDLFTVCLNTDYTAPKTHPMSLFAFDEIVLNNSSQARQLLTNDINRMSPNNNNIRYHYKNKHLQLWASGGTAIKQVQLYTLNGYCVVNQKVVGDLFTCEIRQPGIYIASINQSQYRKKLFLY